MLQPKPLLNGPELTGELVADANAIANAITPAAIQRAWELMAEHQLSPDELHDIALLASVEDAGPLDILLNGDPSKERPEIRGESVIETAGYPLVSYAVSNTPWAMLPSAYAAIIELVKLRASGQRFSPIEIEHRIQEARDADPEAAHTRKGAARTGAVSVLPLYGVVSQRVGMMSQMSGGTSTDAFGRAFKEAIADDHVGGVIIDIDSPGGSVFGVQELWQTIMSARGDKPIIAVANSMAASAAYWLATAADEIVVTPGGTVGSIGVLAAHTDISGAQERAGIKTTLISAGLKKTQGNEFEALGEDALADIQAEINVYYSAFVANVARGRGVAPTAVRGGFGQGGMVLAQDAVKAGMADRVATLDQTISRLLGSKKQDGSRATDRRRAALL